MAFGVFSKNGVILESKEAVMPLSNIEYAYGFGVYETVRAVRGKPLFLTDHLERLMHSAVLLGLKHTFSPPQIERWTDELLTSIDADACNLKMLLIGAKTPEEATLFILPLAPLFPDRKLYTKGAKAITREYERILPQAKCLNMLGSYLAYRDAKAAGAYDALLLNRHRCITEGTRTNFFAMKGRTIISPPKEEILLGVTMKHMLQAAAACGMPVEYRPVPLADLPSFDAAFLTSTSSKVMPLATVDDLTFTITPPLKELMDAFDEVSDAALT
jgi:branched-chain amino acid aminotransferase